MPSTHRGLHTPAARRSAEAVPKAATQVKIFREDYCPLPYTAVDVDMDFNLHEDKTTLVARTR